MISSSSPLRFVHLSLDENGGIGLYSFRIDISCFGASFYSPFLVSISPRISLISSSTTTSYFFWLTWVFIIFTTSQSNGTHIMFHIIFVYAGSLPWDSSRLTEVASRDICCSNFFYARPGFILECVSTDSQDFYNGL